MTGDQLSIDDALLTLDEAKNRLREQLQAGESTICPCCTQTAKIYTYSINHGMVQCLVKLATRGWVHTPDDKFLSRYRGNLTKLQYWGMVERSLPRSENGVGSGYWRITPDGIGWLRGVVQAPVKVSVFNGRVLGTSDETGTVSDAWGSPFNLYIMLATPPEIDQ
jgi:hypothetical protein